MRRRASNQERRASARRGRRNTFAQTQAHLFGRPPTVYVRIAVALALNRYHGGLTSPALVLVYGRLRAKKRFLRCANAHSQERRASARRGSVTHLQWRLIFTGCLRSDRTSGSRPTTGLHEPLLTTRVLRRKAHSPASASILNHGWLTPAAPGARSRFVGCATRNRRKDRRAKLTKRVAWAIMAAGVLLVSPRICAPCRITTSK